jgi:hypothetical protein
MSLPRSRRTSKKALPDVLQQGLEMMRSSFSSHETHDDRPAGAGVMVVPVMVQRAEHERV